MMWEKFPAHSSSHRRSAPCQVVRALLTVEPPQGRKNAKLMPSAFSRLRIGVADFEDCWEAPDYQEVAHEQEVRCPFVG
jgi:hypothetical protein